MICHLLHYTVCSVKIIEEILVQTFPSSLAKHVCTSDKQGWPIFQSQFLGKSMINSRKIPGCKCLANCIKMKKSPKLQFSTTIEVSVLALPLERLNAWCFLKFTEAMVTILKSI